MAVHPRHARFYERYLAFERFGGETFYPSVCDHPAVALCLDFARIDRELPRNYFKFFGVPIPEANLRRQPMSPRDREYFGKLVAPSFDLAPSALHGAPGESVEGALPHDACLASLSY